MVVVGGGPTMDLICQVAFLLFQYPDILIQFFSAILKNFMPEKKISIIILDTNFHV